MEVKIFEGYRSILEQREIEAKLAQNSLHISKHMAMRSCCPYKHGDRTKIRGTWARPGCPMVIDDIQLDRVGGLHKNEWCWILSGRLITKANNLPGKIKVKSVVAVGQEDVESNAEEHSEPEGAGV